MFNIPNFLSLLRIPLAFIFLQANPFYRLLAILLAMITDGLDGYIARKYRLVNPFGTMLDPIMDKFFVFFVMCVLMGENRLSLAEASILICRDFSVMIYGVYLALRRRLMNYKFRAIWCGKVTTVMQFLVLMGLTFQIPFPSYMYGIFIILGVLALAELYQTDRAKRKAASTL